MYYKIRIQSSDRDKIQAIEQQSKDTRPQGLLELFGGLARQGYTESYAKDRVYYIGYLLAKERIQFHITEIQE